MAESIFEDITQRWFIMEPALFQIYCTHHLEKNTSMKCPIRSGKGVIEYNPNLIPADKAIREQYLRSEVMRILLKHPYERQPQGVKKMSVAIASDMVLSDNAYLPNIVLIRADDFRLNHGMHFEWYAHNVDKLIKIVETSKEFGNYSEQVENLTDRVEMWDEDEFMVSELNEAIRDIKDWGSVSGKVVAKIKADLNAKIDYRRALSGFRTSIISTDRSLTRMRPNRRFGFEQMGSKYDMKANILIAVDVSGSISNEDLRHFFGVVCNFFKFGVSQLDVIQFDADIQGEVKRFNKKFHTDTDIKIVGRGGTCFQPVFDHIKAHTQYDGLIIFTDGYADVPTINFHTATKVLWVCDSEQSYNTHHEWMEKLGRACFIECK